ncbi:MAG TPA: alpha-L-fucosidase, partial [Lachnospiraceae bacterium]|nr:alpha-L-fucosidase [Lachnospiraceae bacterium]
MKKTYYPTWESVKTHQVPEWYHDCKLGIFIHWGLYSVPAFATPTVELGVVANEEWFCNNPYAEWYYNSLNMGSGATYEYHRKKYGEDFEYEAFADMWKAEKFVPQEWASLFQQAGAGYVVMVTKHHDGFCLFPSKYTDYSAVNRGPQRDLVGELTEAVREKGLKMGLYYSGMIDWRFADDPIYTEDQVKFNCSPTYEYADYAYKQSLELIDNYHPSVFWNDIGWPFAGERQLPYLLSHYYNVCEDGVVDDRFNDLWKDFSTKEYQYGKVTREEKWEMCRGLGLSFGYNAVESDEHILSVGKLVSLLVSTVANNGNLLINIGPKADGTIPEIQAEKLRGLGSWLAKNGEAVYGTRCSKRTSISGEEADIHFTRKNKDLYVILDGLREGDTAV